jgi:hypothetical protein
VPVSRPAQFRKQPSEFDIIIVFKEPPFHFLSVKLGIAKETNRQARPRVEDIRDTPASRPLLMT